MIKLTRLNNEVIAINVDIIETIEETPDTVITLTTGKKYIVKEKSDNIIEMAIEYKKRCFSKFVT